MLRLRSAAGRLAAVGRRSFVSSAAGTTARKWPRAVCNDHEPTQADIDFYRQNGYIVVRNFLDTEQLALWREVIDKAVLDRGANRFHEGMEDHTNKDEDFYSNVFTQRVNLWRSSPEAAQLLHLAAPAIGRLACALEGSDGMRVWHDQALYKEPLANATSWHVDMPYWSFTSPHALSQWIALDDATLQNGCMHFHPETHLAIKAEAERTGQFEEVTIGSNMNEMYKAMPCLQAVKADPVAAEMRAGDCSFHSGMLVHAAGPNMTLRRRRAMTVQMMPTGATFNGKRNVLTEAEFAALKIGDSMDSDERNPRLA